MKYLILALLFMVIYSIPYSSIALATIIGVFAAIYYYIAFNLTAGLKMSFISNSDIDELQSSTLSVGINLVSVVTLFMETSYQWVALIAAPWICITVATTILSWLVYADYVEIKPKDDEE